MFVYIHVNIHIPYIYILCMYVCMYVRDWLGYETFSNIKFFY